MIDKSAKIFVAGHNGLAGSSIVDSLLEAGYENIVTIDRKSLDLEVQPATYEWLSEVRPEVVILAAGKVGGILANDTFPADFLLSNLRIQTNVIHWLLCRRS